MTLEEIKRYIARKNLNFNIEVLENLYRLKENAKKQNDELLANEIWKLETICKIQIGYLDLFNLLKQGKFFEAWKRLERVDIEFSFLRSHFDYANNEFNLKFIEQVIRDYEKLFPYEYFASRESIIKKQKCSICNKYRTIRSRCEHKIGNLYMGEMCGMIIEDVELLAIAIVKNPFDKYTVLFPEGLEYNYEMLETLINTLNTPYDRWNITEYKELTAEYKDSGRNDKCPCGSGRKYKKCCLGKEKTLRNHYHITLIDNVPAKPIKKFTSNTWKN